MALSFAALWAWFMAYLGNSRTLESLSILWQIPLAVSLGGFDLDFRAPHETRSGRTQRSAPGATRPQRPQLMSRHAKRDDKTPATSQAATANLLCDLTANLGDHNLHSLNIGAKRDVLAISTKGELRARAGRSPGPKNFRVHHWHAGNYRQFDLPPTPQIYYHVQPLGNDYLCVASRCAPDEPNAHLFDDGGNALSSFHAGDGIEEVQVAPDSKIWISYFDEGVFSGSPLSSEGLVCFDARGRAAFRLPNRHRELAGIRAGHGRLLRAQRRFQSRCLVVLLYRFSARAFARTEIESRF